MCHTEDEEGGNDDHDSDDEDKENDKRRDTLCNSSPLRWLSCSEERENLADGVAQSEGRSNLRERCPQVGGGPGREARDTVQATIQPRNLKPH